MVCLLLSTTNELFSQIIPDTNDRHLIAIHHLVSPGPDGAGFRVLESFKSEADLVSGTRVFNELSNADLLQVSYHPLLRRGIFTRCSEGKIVSGGEFILSGLKENRQGDSLRYYRDLIKDGVWYYTHTDTTQITRYVFDRGELMSFGYYKGDTLLEGGTYKGGKRIGEWLMLGDYLEKACYSDNGDLIYNRLISRLGGKIQRECYAELPEKTTMLEGISESVTFWYIIDYNEQGTVRERGHYIYANDAEWSDNWYYIPYGLHEIWENGKVTKKMYPKMPTEIKYSVVL